MKLLVASDIHGSEYYCQKLAEVFENEKPDKILLLGDILYHGPRNDLPKGYNPKNVIKILNDYKNDILCVRGNCDTEVDQMVLDFPILSDYAFLFIDSKKILATHGHLQPPCENTFDVIINGHTHIPRNETKNGILYLNPGSISIPKQNSSNSYFIIYSNEQFNFKVVFKTLDK